MRDNVNRFVLASALALGAALASCGGGETETTAVGGGQTGTGGGETHVVGDVPAVGAAPGSAALRCGPNDSYFWVATKFKCPGGGNPLGGDTDAGGRARRGNIGPGPDGHILDVYDVPCPSGTVAVYVDMYHCRPGQPMP